MQKNQKIQRIDFVTKLKKLILGQFLPKTPSTRFFPKNSFESVLILNVIVTSCKKLE